MPNDHTSFSELKEAGRIINSPKVAATGQPWLFVPQDAEQWRLAEFPNDLPQDVMSPEDRATIIAGLGRLCSTLGYPIVLHIQAKTVALGVGLNTGGYSKLDDLPPGIYDTCARLDADVFCGDTLCDPGIRKQLGEYLERWTRKLREFESDTQPTEEHADAK